MTTTIPLQTALDFYFLASLLEWTPAEEFDFRQWQCRNACGTTHCVAGLAATLPKFQRRGLSAGTDGTPEFDGYCTGYALARFFGIPINDAYRLFFPCTAGTAWPGFLPRFASRSDLAAHLRRYVAERKVV